MSAILKLEPTDKIKSVKEGHIGWLIVDAPETRNAMALNMWAAAGRVLEDFAADPNVRVVILRGGGDKTFISGGDLADMNKRPSPEAQAEADRIRAHTGTVLRTMGKPTIAMIRGYCLGGGMGFALNCDLRVCSERPAPTPVRVRLALAAALLGAAGILVTLQEDARTAGRWYIVVMMGRNAGHLALGAGHSANATMTLVAEEYGGAKVSLDRMARTVEGSILKSTADGRAHGVIVLAEGLGECLDPSDLAAFPDLPRDEHGHLRLAELPLGRLVRDRVEKGLKLHGIKTTMVVKDVGYELRCVAPNAFDQEYTRELGAAAVSTLLAGHANVMITRQNQKIVPIPFEQILDPKTGKTRIRMLDTQTESFASAMALQTRLAASDLEEARSADPIANVSRLPLVDLKTRFFA